MNVTIKIGTAPPRMAATVLVWNGSSPGSVAVTPSANALCIRASRAVAPLDLHWCLFWLLLGKIKKRKSVMERGMGDKILESCLLFIIIIIIIIIKYIESV
jgi:hypothetical protein